MGVEGRGHGEVGKLHVEEVMVVSKVAEGGGGQVRVAAHEV